MTTTLQHLNACGAVEFVRILSGIYEHSPWIPERAATQRPFASLTALKQSLQGVVESADEEEQLSLIRAHPELAGKAAIAGQLTKESTGEQARAGLNNCSPEEFATLQKLNADYNAKFGFPFILAVKGPDGKGLTRRQIIATFSRRLKNCRADELAEDLRQIHRIAELRLNDLFGHTPSLGNTIMEWAEAVGAWSNDDDGLTCAYMTMAHRKAAALLAAWMREAGMEVHIDAVGNVVGRYPSGNPAAKTLMTGSHYDTVRNGGKYDGREGILLPIAVVRHLHERGEKLPFHLDIIAFSEREGVRYKSAFLGSNAIAGRFDMKLLDKPDADGIPMRTALLDAGHNPDEIPQIARKREDLFGFVEVHIEQGPVLLERGLPAGIVTSIASTTAMDMRKDTAPAVPCAPWLMEQLAASTARAGVAPFKLASTAGHDAAAIAAITDVAMLFTRCGNGGISHNPLETMTADDAEISAQIFLDFLRNFTPAGDTGLTR